MPIADPWVEYCRRLNRFYRQGELKILVGAGLSRSAKLPDWGALNKGLLKKYIERDLQGDKTAGLVDVDGLVEDLYNALGRDAAADFVWNSAAPEMFFDDLAELLYQGRSFSDLKLSIAHRQLAAMDLAELYTMNFDPLLELALQASDPNSKDAELHPRHYRQTNLLAQRGPERQVYHLHGWVDPDGFRGGEFVLTEAHYFELFTRRGERPNLLLDHVLTSGGAVLILGMSMSDTNLRRQLYLRSRNQLTDPTEIYAVMKSEDKKLISGYQIAHWSSRGVRLVPIDNYDDIPNLLRQVKYGPSEGSDPLTWIGQSLRWVEERLPDERRFSDAWQAGAHQALLSLKSEIESSFEVPDGEKLTLSFLVPVSPAELGIMADTRKARTGEEAKNLAKNFRLRVEKSKPQGISGVAFSQGKPFAVLNDPDAADKNFTASMRDYYAAQGLRDWKSLTAIPVLDTPDFLPVAVVSVGSMRSEPFWTHLGAQGESATEEFHTALRKAAQSLLTPAR